MTYERTLVAQLLALHFAEHLNGENAAKLGILHNSFL
jgi:hypothetical protein